MQNKTIFVGLVATFSVATFVSPVSAQVAAPLPAPDAAPAPAESPPREWKLGLVQAGTALAVTAGATIAVMNSGVQGDAGLALLAAVPPAAALSVCALGQISRHYEGRCLLTVGAALLTFPVTLTMLLPRENPADDPSPSAIAAAWMLLPPLLATASWHLFKRPRTPALASLAAPAPLRPLALYQPRRRSAPVAGQTVVPLLSSTF